MSPPPLSRAAQVAAMAEAAAARGRRVAADPVSLLAVLALVLVARLLSSLFRRVGSWLSSRGASPDPAAALGSLIRTLRREAEELNSPATFAQHAKIKRRIVKLEMERERLAAEYTPPPPSFAAVLGRYLHLLPKVALYTFATRMWWSMPLFSLRALGMPAWVQPAEGFGVVAWLAVCHAGLGRVGL